MIIDLVTTKVNGASYLTFHSPVNLVMNYYSGNSNDEVELTKS